jgi:hypothetical protein
MDVAGDANDKRVIHQLKAVRLTFAAQYSLLSPDVLAYGRH